MNTPEHNNFTILRLALALLVVLGHFVTLRSDTPATGLFGYADLAVDMFFIVSGYLIFASFDHKPVLGVFYIRRLFRIYPLYMTVVIVQGLIMAALAGGIQQHASELLHYLMLNLVMATFLAHDIGGLLSNMHNPGINPSLWTLKIEVGFYLILPVLWYFTRRFKGSFLLLVFAFSTLYTAITLHYGMDSFAKQLPGQMRFFVTGMALYYYREFLTFPTLPAVFVAVGLFLLCKFYPEFPLVMPLYPICAGLIMHLVVFRMPLLLVPFDISYGVYLVHGPLIQFSILLGLFSDTGWFLTLLLGSVFLLAFVAERCIEQPGIELGKRLSRTVAMRFKKIGA